MRLPLARDGQRNGDTIAGAVGAAGLEPRDARDVVDQGVGVGGGVFQRRQVGILARGELCNLALVFQKIGAELEHILRAHAILALGRDRPVGVGRQAVGRIEARGVKTKLARPLVHARDEGLARSGGVDGKSGRRFIAGGHQHPVHKLTERDTGAGGHGDHAVGAGGDPIRLIGDGDGVGKADLAALGSLAQQQIGHQLAEAGHREAAAPLLVEKDLPRVRVAQNDGVDGAEILLPRELVDIGREGPGGIEQQRAVLFPGGREVQHQLDVREAHIQVAVSVTVGVIAPLGAVAVKAAAGKIEIDHPPARRGRALIRGGGGVFAGDKGKGTVVGEVFKAEFPGRTVHRLGQVGQGEIEVARIALLIGAHRSVLPSLDAHGQQKGCRISRLGRGGQGREYGKAEQNRKQTAKLFHAFSLFLMQDISVSDNTPI